MTFYEELKTTSEFRVVGYLTAKADEFLLENFKMRLSIPIVLNGRLTRTLGHFTSEVAEIQKRQTPDGWVTEHNISVPDSIHLSKRMLKVNEVDKVLDVLYHECVHYALLMLRVNNTDNAPAFEHTLKHLGISSNHYKNNKMTYAVEKNIYVCTNPSCQKVSQISHRWKPETYVKRFICGKCRSRLEYRETIVKQITPQYITEEE